jgi:hypothetical protein
MHNRPHSRRQAISETMCIRMTSKQQELKKHAGSAELLV